jgi:hypothetical protein
MTPLFDMLTTEHEVRTNGDVSNAQSIAANGMATPASTPRVRPRYELKYPLPDDCHEQLRRDLLSFLEPDKHARASGGRYVVRSLYFDTPNLRFYYDKLEGNSCRLKVRIRRYESADDRHARWFFEVKRKYHNACVKSPRVAFTDEILENHLRDHGTIRLNELVAMIHGGRPTKSHADLWALPLQPTVLLSYDRHAFTDPYGSRLRVTLDSDYRARFSADPYRSLRPWDQIAVSGVMELKFERAIPFWLEALVRKYRLQLASTSKYGEGVESSFPLRAMAHARAAIDEGLPSTTTWFLRTFGS